MFQPPRFPRGRAFIVCAITCARSVRSNEKKKKIEKKIEYNTCALRIKNVLFVRDVSLYTPPRSAPTTKVLTIFFHKKYNTKQRSGALFLTVNHSTPHVCTIWLYYCLLLFTRYTWSARAGHIVVVTGTAHYFAFVVSRAVESYFFLSHAEGPHDRIESFRGPRGLIVSFFTCTNNSTET